MALLALLASTLGVWPTREAAAIPPPAGLPRYAAIEDPAADSATTDRFAVGQAPSHGGSEPGIESLLADVERLADEPLPTLNPAALSQKTAAIEAVFDALATLREGSAIDVWIDRAQVLVRTERSVDRLLESFLDRRVEVSSLAEEPLKREAARRYLSVASTLIDVAGRVRYRLYDALYDAAYEVAAVVEARDRLVDAVSDELSSIGASVVAELLFDPPPENPNGAVPADPRTKRLVLELIARTGSRELLPVVVRFLEEPNQPPDLVLAAIDAVRRLGMPQDPRPGQDPSLPRPVTTAAALRARLLALGRGSVSGPEAGTFQQLAAWLERQAARGLEGQRFRLGRFEVQPGDWLLMRNPSPYNLFTDLSPGLFTHVGVITLEESPDGRRRMVLVDLPERGKKMEATNIDLFVERTLHYVVLRHDDPHVAAVMAERAREAIGCATEFDLNFRTERVQELRGRPLESTKIHTYCAGLLLLCAQETGRERREFFPLVERPAGGHTAENLARLGIRFGREFVSPSGALFSPHLRMVGRRQAMYEPGREIEQAIYDHFADRLRARVLEPTADLTQALRGKLAELAAANPQLSRALADAAGVGSDTDLVSAARALSVIETLDQVAMGSSAEFRRARQALLEQPQEEETGEGRAAGSEPDWAEAYRARHRQLGQLWLDGRLSPRDLRIALVKHYTESGKRQIDQRFFAAERAGRYERPADVSRHRL